MPKEPGWMAKQIHKLDRLDAEPGSTPSGKETSESFGLVNFLKTNRVSAAAQSYTWTVPTDRIWVVYGITAMNNNRGGTYYCNIKEGDVDTQFTTALGTSTTGNVSADCLTGLNLPVFLRQRTTVQVWNHNYVAGDTNIFMNRIAEVQI